MLYYVMLLFGTGSISYVIILITHHVGHVNCLEENPSLTQLYIQ